MMLYRVALAGVDVLRQRLFDALRVVEPSGPRIAALSNTGRYRRQAEVDGGDVAKLAPRERHRDRRAGKATRRIGDAHRLAAHVHVRVDEHLAGALLHLPVERDVLRVRTR